MGKDKADEDGLAGVENFKPGHACRVVLALPQVLLIGGAKIHAYDKNTHEHMYQLVTGSDVTAIYYSGTNLFIGLHSGEIKYCSLSEGEDASTAHLARHSKAHSAAITAIDMHEDQMWVAAADGTISVWDGMNQVVSRDKPSKKAKQHYVKFFHEKDTVVSITDKAYVFRSKNFEEEQASSLVHQGQSHMKSITGFAHERGIRVFVGHDDGTIGVYDIPDGILDITILPKLEHNVHTKSIVHMCMFGHHLCASGSDKMVTVWNGKETSSECNLVRKLKHKGVVSSMSYDNSNGGQVMWCYDESNKKMYNINLKEHIPSLGRGGHHTKMTFDLDPMGGDGSEPGSPRASHEDPATDQVSPLARTADFEETLAAALEASPSERRTGGLTYKDFYSDTGTLQAVFDKADAWVQDNPHLQIMSISTVPIAGSRSTTDVLFLHSLKQAVYEAALRTKPDTSINVIQVVRVVYYDRS